MFVVPYYPFNSYFYFKPLFFPLLLHKIYHIYFEKIQQKDQNINVIHNNLTKKHLEPALEGLYPPNFFYVERYFDTK